MQPNYIETTYGELKSMGFIGYEITYYWDEDADFVNEELEDYEGSLESNEIMAPWESLEIIKKLFCKDYGLPVDEVDIEERELTIDELTEIDGLTPDDAITYIAKDDPYYKTL